MRIYVVVAYPNHDGLCYAAFQNVCGGLTEAGHELRITDLYEDYAAGRFDPVLVFNHEKRRRDLKDDPETAEYRDNIIWAEHLVFVFPIWWSGMPAILKGFFDRVFASGFSYHYKEKHSLLMTGDLKGKSAWIVTTDDTPGLVSFLILQGYGRTLKMQILLQNGIKPIKRHRITAVRYGTREKQAKRLEKLRQKARNFKGR